MNKLWLSIIYLEFIHKMKYNTLHNNTKIDLNCEEEKNLSISLKSINCDLLINNFIKSLQDKTSKKELFFKFLFKNLLNILNGSTTCQKLINCEMGIIKYLNETLPEENIIFPEKNIGYSEEEEEDEEEDKKEDEEEDKKEDILLSEEDKEDKEEKEEEEDKEDISLSEEKKEDKEEDKEDNKNLGIYDYYILIF